MHLFSLRAWLSGTAAMVAVFMALAPPARAQGGGDGFGAVEFNVSCTARSQERFNRAVAMLHAFSPEARGAFTSIAEAEPDCVMANWGVAMAVRGNPLTDALSPEAVQRGREALRKARAVPAKTERERDWIRALAVYFAAEPGTDRLTRARPYEAAMEELRNRYPEDEEVEIFYALSLNEAVDPGDLTYERQIKAATILERLEGALLEHPGIPHYLIHSYDHPALAAKGEPAARRLSRIAPTSAHALHMPSHIFSMLGLWQDAIRADRAADDFITADAARGHRNDDPAPLPDRYHALDSLTYAYLQLAQDGEARHILDGRHLVGTLPPGFIPSSHVAFAAIPVRYALERGAWAEAARLEVARTPFAEAAIVTWFARALGAARSGNPAGARDSLRYLVNLGLQFGEAGETHWARQVAIYERAALAWTLLAERRRREALTLMREAVDLENETGKHVALEIRLVPMRELLGEMFLELRQPALALSEFGASLQSSPNRFRSIAGAAQAAERMGSDAFPIARRYYEKLLELTSEADNERPEMDTARRFLGRLTQTASGAH